MYDSYDAGLLSDYGGGDVQWWHDYLRAELGRADDFYSHQIEGLNTEKEMWEDAAKRWATNNCDIIIERDNWRMRAKNAEDILSKAASKLRDVLENGGNFDSDDLMNWENFLAERDDSA